MGTTYACGLCGETIYELGESPLCFGCSKYLCRKCERKHDKDRCEKEHRERKVN